MFEIPIKNARHSYGLGSFVETDFIETIQNPFQCHKVMVIEVDNGNKTFTFNEGSNGFPKAIKKGNIIAVYEYSKKDGWQFFYYTFQDAKGFTYKACFPQREIGLLVLHK